jgi:hypothetical protein
MKFFSHARSTATRVPQNNSAWRENPLAQKEFPAGVSPAPAQARGRSQIVILIFCVKPTHVA